MRSRSSVVLSLPVLLLACLILTSNARAQDSITFQPCVSPSQMLQVLLDRQQTPLNQAVPKAGLQTTSFHFAVENGRARAGVLLPVVAFEPRHKFAPAQFFGNGSQAAP